MSKHATDSLSTVIYGLFVKLIAINLSLGIVHSIKLAALKEFVVCRCLDVLNVLHGLTLLVIKRTVFTDLQVFENMSIFHAGLLTSLFWDIIVFVETLLSLLIIPFTTYVMYLFLLGAHDQAEDEETTSNMRLKIMVVVVILLALGYVGVKTLNDISYYPLEGTYSFISTITTSPETFTFVNQTNNIGGT